MPEIVVRLTDGEDREFGDLLVRACARQMLERYAADEDGDEYSVPSPLADRIKSAVVEVIHEQAAAAAPGIVEKILAAGVVETDRYGYGRGEAKPIAEIVADQVRQEVRTGSHRGETALERLIREEVTKQFHGEMKAAIDEAKRPVLDAIREQATGVFENAMRDALPGF